MLLTLLLISANPDGTANDQDYKIVTEGSSTKVKKGAQGELQVKIVPLNGFKCSDETPFNLSVTPSAGLSFAQAKFGRKDLVDPKSKEPVIKAKFDAREKGAQTVKADVKFYLCTDKLCQPMTSTAEVAVTVN